MWYYLLAHFSLPIIIQTPSICIYNIPCSITMLHINSCRFLKFSSFFSFLSAFHSWLRLFSSKEIIFHLNHVDVSRMRYKRCDELKYGWCGGVSMEIRTNNMTFTRKITFITSRMTGLTPFIIWLLIKWMGIHFTFSWMWLNLSRFLLQKVYI